LAEAVEAAVGVVVAAVVLAAAASHFLVVLFQVVPAAQAQFGGYFLASKHLAQPLAH